MSITMSFKRLGSGLPADTRTNLLIGSSGNTSDVKDLAIGYLAAKRSIEMARYAFVRWFMPAIPRYAATSKSEVMPILTVRLTRGISPIGLADGFTTTWLVWHPCGKREYS